MKKQLSKLVEQKVRRRSIQATVVILVTSIVAIILTVSKQKHILDTWKTLSNVKEIDSEVNNEQTIQTVKQFEKERKAEQESYIEVYKSETDIMRETGSCDQTTIEPTFDTDWSS